MMLGTHSFFKRMFTSKNSMMSKGLLNTLTREAISDLIAYLDGWQRLTVAVGWQIAAQHNLHCRSGGRVLTVSKLLRAQGYDTRPLKVGYSKLLKEGFEKAPEKKQ